MNRRTLILGLCLIAMGCGQNSDTQSTASTPGSSQATGGGLAIEFRNYPNPPKTGDNTVEAIVSGPDGKPVTDATVTTTLSMPAMPAMNMPEMSNSVTLVHQGEGHYRGMGQLSMAGTWNVTVSVSREGKEIGSTRSSIVVK